MQNPIVKAPVHLTKLATGGTKKAVAIPAGAKRLRVRCRDNAREWQMSFLSTANFAKNGEDGEYMSFNAGEVYTEYNLDTAGKALTLQLFCAGDVIFEVLYWI